MAELEMALRWEEGCRDIRVRPLKDKIVVRRKDGSCAMCWGQVKKGERARVKAAIVDEELMHLLYCESCCEAQALDVAEGDWQHVLAREALVPAEELDRRRRNA